MANVVHITCSDGKTDYTFPLIDDIALEMSTDWTSFTDDLGEVGDIVDYIVKLGQVGQGTLSGIDLYVQNIMNAKRWKSTSPLRFSIKVLLVTETDPKKDVWDKYIKLAGSSILRVDEAGSYHTPGINLSNLAGYRAAGNQKDAQAKKNELLNTGEFISVEIPNIIYLERALLESVKPIISKEKTQSGYPLWISLELTIESLFPANTAMLMAAAKMSETPRMSKTATTGR